MEYIDTAYVEAKAYYGNLLAGMDKEMLPLNDVEGEAESRAQRNPSKAPRLTSLMAYAYGAGERERVP